MESAWSLTSLSLHTSQALCKGFLQSVRWQASATRWFYSQFKSIFSTNFPKNPSNKIVSSVIFFLCQLSIFVEQKNSFVVLFFFIISIQTFAALFRIVCSSTSKIWDTVFLLILPFFNFSHFSSLETVFVIIIIIANSALLALKHYEPEQSLEPWFCEDCCR